MSPGEPSGLVFCVLGPLRVEAPEREVRIGGARRRGVLLRLLGSPGRPVPVDVLADDVWDGDPPAAAASTLQSHVSALRQVVGAGRLGFLDGGYRLAVGPDELDSLMFEADVAAGRAATLAGDFESAAGVLDRALARWRGEAFADVAGAPWSVLPAGHLDEMRKIAVEEALEAHLALGHHHEVCGLAEEAVAAEPLRERRWAALMLALYRAGRQADALAAYRRLRETLADQLGLDPSPRLARLEHEILLQSPALDWTGTVPGSTVDKQTVPLRAPGGQSNLPSPVARFVGRASELAELDKLATQDRLVTIVGTGGAGKTRLAIEAAAARVGEYRDGVWFVDLAELTDPGGVPAAIAAAIGLQPAPGQPVEPLLVERASGMRALLVVDNCEHLLGAVAATVEKMLEAGPGVRVLATSRQPLRVPGERVWQTPPIAFPATPHFQDPAGLASFDAVRLFLDRAPDLADVSPGQLRVIAEITARLDGLPLAIELAAARAGQLGLAQLAVALEDRVSLTWLGSRTGRARQQTLAATIGWSYDLLTPQLQTALKRLAVFSGGFTLEAAGAVTGAAGNAADMVTALAEQSLIEADRTSRGAGSGRAEARYRMLETIRQYCAGRIADEGPAANSAARTAHANYFAHLAQRAAAALSGWHQGRWMTALEADHANLVTAITYLLTTPGRASAAVQMIVHLDRFWRVRGHQAECLTLLRRGLDTTGPNLDTTLRCEALLVGWGAAIRNDIQATRSYATEALQLARTAGDDFHAARALEGLAIAAAYAGDVDPSSAAGTAAVELARSVGDPMLLGECLMTLGGLTGDPLERRAIFQEALAVTRRSGDRLGTYLSHNDFGNTLLIEEDLDAARHHFEQAQTIGRELGVPVHSPLVNLGWIYLRSGDVSAADTAFAQTLRLFELNHDRIFGSAPLLGLACSAAARRDWERAARLLGFADGQLQDCNAVWIDPERTYREQLLADIQHHVGTSFERCYDSGRTGDRSDLIDLALGEQQTR
jgi:predicted ATPase/DNA-binding SARP family transcriptional activator